MAAHLACGRAVATLSTVSGRQQDNKTAQESENKKKEKIMRAGEVQWEEEEVMADIDRRPTGICDAEDEKRSRKAS